MQRSTFDRRAWPVYHTESVYNVNVSVEFKVTLHEQVRYNTGALRVLNVTVGHTAGHYGEEYDD